MDDDDGKLCECYRTVDSCVCGDLVQDVPMADCPCIRLGCECTLPVKR